MNKTVLITGSSSGFGKAAAMAFHTAGWNVVATMRNTSAWTEADLRSGIQVVKMDVTDPSSIRDAVDQSILHFGAVDCVVNNAGAALLSVFEVTPTATIREIFETNFFGPLQVMQAVIPHFRENEGGRFVNVSSGAAITPDPFMATYSASKLALEGLTEGLAFELSAQNITLKLIEPGFVPTTNLVSSVHKLSSNIPVPHTYQGVFDKTIAMYNGELPLGLASESSVSEAILSAAVDDGDQLRYVIGADVIQSAHMRRETSEMRYLAWSRGRLGL